MNGVMLSQIEKNIAVLSEVKEIKKLLIHYKLKEKMENAIDESINLQNDGVCLTHFVKSKIASIKKDTNQIEELLEREIIVCFMYVRPLNKLLTVIFNDPVPKRNEENLMEYILNDVLTEKSIIKI